MPLFDERPPSGRYTALDNAIRTTLLADTEAVQVLLNSGAISVADIKAGFHTAVFHNKAACLALLIKHAKALDISLDVKNAAGNTPLESAIIQGNIDCISPLIKAGAKLPKGIFTIPTPLAKHDLELVVKNTSFELFQGAIESEDPLKNTKKLIKKGYSADCYSLNKKTPLMLAAGMDNLPLIMLLLQHGADMKSTDLVKFNVFHYCVEGGNSSSLLTLIQDSLRDNNENFSKELKAELENIDDPGAKLELLDQVSVAIMANVAGQYKASPRDGRYCFFLALREDAPNVSQSMDLDIVRGFYKAIAFPKGQEPMRIEPDQSPALCLHDSPYSRFAIGPTKSLVLARDKMDALPALDGIEGRQRLI